MPYYMGDYYAGDPGFGSIFKRVGGFIARRIPIVGGLIPRGAPKALPAAAGAAMERIGGFAGGTLGGIVRRGETAIIKHPVISAAAAAGTIGVLGGMGAGREMGAGGVVPRGFHIERRGKHPGAIIRNRRMRVTNPRALRRALRRAHGFAKLAMRTIHLVHPKKKVRFGGFRRKRATR